MTLAERTTLTEVLPPLCGYKYLNDVERQQHRHRRTGRTTAVLSQALGQAIDGRRVVFLVHVPGMWRGVVNLVKELRGTNELRIRHPSFQIGVGSLGGVIRVRTPDTVAAEDGWAEVVFRDHVVEGVW